MTELKLHLGCGKKYLVGFTHLDLDEFPHIDHIAPMHQLKMFSDNSVSTIYSSHALEYYDRDEVDQLLQEWKRVLAPKGTIYVTVPDFDALISIYRATGLLKSIIGPMYGKWPNLLTGESIAHKTVWNEKDLSEKVRVNGFTNISKFDPIEFLKKIDPDYDDYSLAYYPHMDKTGIQVSLALKFSRD